AKLAMLPYIKMFLILFVAGFGEFIQYRMSTGSAIMKTVYPKYPSTTNPQKHLAQYLAPKVLGVMLTHAKTGAKKAYHRSPVHHSKKAGFSPRKKQAFQPEETP